MARALTRPLRASKPPRRILEVGPGTGAVTREIVRCLRPGDQLDIVEINPKFAAIVEQRFAHEKDFHAKRGLVRIICAPIQQLPGAAWYDFMISGIPLNNFSLELVDSIFQSYQRLLQPEGVLSYFEYLAIRQMKMAFADAEERRRLQALSDYLGRKIRRYQFAADVVLLNIPPAVARHFCFAPSGVNPDERSR